MVRIVVYLFLFIIVVAFARAVVNLIGRVFSQALQSAPRQQAQVPVTGELKKDPVCGTYISTETSLRKVSGGTTFYFCSPECQKRFLANS